MSFIKNLSKELALLGYFIKFRKNKEEKISKFVFFKIKGGQMTEKDNDIIKKIEFLKNYELRLNSGNLTAVNLKVKKVIKI